MGAQPDHSPCYRVRVASPRRVPFPRPGYLLVLLASALFAAAGNGVKVLFQQGYSPLALAQLRIGWAFSWLVAWLLIARRPLLRLPPRELVGLAGFGMLGVAGVQLAYYLTIARLNIAVALLVQYLGLVGVAAWERYRRHQVVSAHTWGPMLLVLIGCFLAVGAFRPALLRVNLPGILFGMLAATLFAFYLLRASRLARRLDDTWTILVYAFGAGTLMWALYDLGARAALPSQARVWVAMAVIGLAGTLLPYGLFIRALKTIRPSRAGIVGTSEPVFAGLIALLVLNDGLEPLQILGGALVIGGVVIVQLSGDESPQLATPAPA